MVAVLDTPSASTRAPKPASTPDWRRVAYTLLVSRRIDELEETTLLPARKLLYQFSARGHDLAQILLGCELDNRRDGATGYYRSRPLLLTLGLPLADALGSPMMRAGGMSDGRDIGVVFNLPNRNGPCVLPVCGG
ncbi:MAG: pyruvate dehydrogenase, partial [Pseudomonadota bacterium]